MRDEPSVLHLDADAFFAAVEQRQRPSLRGRPVIVGGLGPRGVVATASYEARRFGVGSAMPMARARTLCPAGVFLTPRFDAYSAHSAVLMELLREASPLVQPISLDEAFVDLAAGTTAPIRWRRPTTSGANSGGGPGSSSRSASGRSKLIAKLASEAGKPHGWTVITAEQEDDFLLPTPVGKLWGVGPATESVLHGIGVRTVAQLRETPQADLVRLLGVAHGNGLHRLAFGIDERPVESDRETKSISAERTFAFDITGREAHSAELDSRLQPRPAPPDAPRRQRRAPSRSRPASATSRPSRERSALRQPTTDPRALLTAAEQALAGRRADRRATAPARRRLLRPDRPRPADPRLRRTADTAETTSPSRIDDDPADRSCPPRSSPRSRRSGSTCSCRARAGWVVAVARRS